MSRSVTRYIARKRRDEVELVRKIHQVTIRHGRYGYRRVIVLLRQEVCQWLEKSGCQTLFINPGNTWENGYIESFIDKLRDECLNREIFRNGQEAQVIVENWRQEYNNYRPHSSLGYLTPSEFAR